MDHFRNTLVAHLMKPRFAHIKKTACGRLQLGRFVVVLMLLMTAAHALPHSAAAQKAIYAKTDEEGVLCLTDRNAEGYRVYMVFRDIMRQYGHVNRGEIVSIATRWSERYGLDPRLVQSVIEVESGFCNEVTSSAGAEGLMQIMPETQRDLGVTQPFDPNENIAGGVRYLRQMLDRFGSLELALAAYNAGPGNVEKYGGVPPFKETRNYVRKVLALYKP